MPSPSFAAATDPARMYARGTSSRRLVGRCQVTCGSADRTVTEAAGEYADLVGSLGQAHPVNAVSRSMGGRAA